MDWFERLTGFREVGYEATRARLELEGGRLRSTVNGESYAVGKLELASLRELRLAGEGAGGSLKGSVVQGAVRGMHRNPAHAGALFQVASQFNLLEMIGPDVTPEDGVTRYEHDPTQGPACAIAAGAATIYRNYFAPVDGRRGQTAARQIDGLADLASALSLATGHPPAELWRMRNGYALAGTQGLDIVARHLRSLSAAGIDAMRDQIRIGLHWDVEATEADGPDRPLVSQAFCSALPLAYCEPEAASWEPLARLVLEAAYEATLWAGVRNAARGVSNVVFLTRLGGGAFGNPGEWIDDAVARALNLFAAYDLDVRMVSFGSPSTGLLDLMRAKSPGGSPRTRA